MSTHEPRGALENLQVKALRVDLEHVDARDALRGAKGVEGRYRHRQRIRGGGAAGGLGGEAEAVDFGEGLQGDLQCFAGVPEGLDMHADVRPGLDIGLQLLGGRGHKFEGMDRAAGKKLASGTGALP